MLDVEWNWNKVKLYMVGVMKMDLIFIIILIDWWAGTNSSSQPNYFIAMNMPKD